MSEQEAECRAWAEREGWDVVEVIEETGSASRFGRSTSARQRWAEVTALVRSGRVDILLTWEHSRATRQLEEYAELRNLCAKHGVLWGYTGTVYDLTQREARFRTGLDALLAEDESARTSERILRASRARAAAGTPHGKLPYGYRREYDPKSGALLRQVPDDPTLDEAGVEVPGTAPIAREIITRVAAGETYYAIANDLTERGVPLPRPARSRHNSGSWLGTTVKRIACSPTYAGIRVHRGAVVGDASWPALVDQETHERAVAAVEDATRVGPRQDRSVKHILTGIARCGVCGGPLVRRLNRGRYAGYACRISSCVSRKQEDLETHVVERVLLLLSDFDPPSPADEISADVAAVEAEIAALDERLAQLIAQAADGSITPATLARVEARIQTQLTVATRRLRALRRPQTLARWGDLEDPAALWESLDLAGRRALLADVVDVSVLPSNQGRRAFDPASVTVTPKW